MRLRISKIIFIFICLAALFSFTVMQVFAVPTITGKVVMAGSGQGIGGVWVKWMEDYGTPYQSAYRYDQTDVNGVYSFPDLANMPVGTVNKMVQNQLDTNFDNVPDDYELYVNESSPIPNASNGATFDQHFNAANSPHAYIQMIPVTLSGNSSIVSNITLNDADTTLTLPDIVFTPSATSSASPTPAPIYSISGKVYIDSNKDGNIDNKEPDYKGATINLTGDKSSVTTTDSNGNYSFTGLLAGTYTVTIATPVGYSTTTSSSSNINLSKNQTVYFGLAKAVTGAGCAASIKGSVINDLNLDGNLDSGEASISNWTVSLSAADLPSPLNTKTDSSGQYTFSNLCTDTFTVTQSIPSPWITTKSQSVVMNVNDGNNYTNVNFYVAQKFSVSGHAFLDPNGDGILTSNSSGFRGIIVLLIGSTGAGPIFRQVTTPADGFYSFTDLPVGDYKLLFGIVDGYRSTTANAVNINLINNQIFDYGLTPSSLIKVGGVCNNTTLDIMLVMDHSGSMSQADAATGKPKIEEARSAANAFVDIVMQFLPTARIGIVQFSDSNNFNINNTGNSYPSSLLTNPTNDKTILHSIIDSLTATGATCHQCGVKLANESLNSATRPNTQKMIIFLTDGLANRTADDPGVAIDPAAAENSAMNDIIDGVNSQNIIYNTIGQGANGIEADNIDEEFLIAIANTNGGSYYNNPTNGDLQAIFQAILSSSIPTGAITGFVFNDKDLSASFTTGDEFIPNMPIILTGGNLPANLTTKSDANGNYGFFGLCDSNFTGTNKSYTVSEVSTPPWLLTTAGSYTLTIQGGAEYKNNNFGNRFGYYVTGFVFNDLNKNRIRESSDENFAEKITINSKGSVVNGIVSVNPDGSYKVDGLYPGSYIISYTSGIPKGYNLIWPVNGPPPSYSVNVGPGCSVDKTTGSSCTNDQNIINLNFAISNSVPWIQSYGLDSRFDNGITNFVPPGTACGGGAYASGTENSFKTPGVIFSGDSSSDFGQGRASDKNWVVGGMSYPEVFKNNSTLKTSTKNLLASATKTGIYPTALETAVPGNQCGNPANRCNLQSLKKGFYRTTGDLDLSHPVNFGSGNYVIIADGTISISKNITVSPGATLLLAAGHDIIIDPSVSAPANTCPVPAGQIQGIYSADHNIIIEGNNGDCLKKADTMINIDGAFIVNAAKSGGTFQNKRDLCGDNRKYPSLTVKTRPDFILNTPGILTTQQVISHEEAP